MIINEQIARYLNEKNIGVFDKTGTTGNIYVNQLPEKDNSISIISIGGRRIGSKLGLGIYKKSVYIKIRGSKNGIESEEFANTVYNNLVSFEGYLVDGEDRILLIDMLEGGVDVLGLDKNGNIMMGIKMVVMFESDKGVNNNDW